MNIEYPYTSASSASSATNRIHSYREIIETYVQSPAVDKPLLDTAYYYANGKCEEILGEILPTLSRPVKLATKANPWFANDFTCGKYGQLAREPLTNQLLGSLSRLQQENVDAFFLHCPDPETPLKETLDTCDELWRRERFDRFGVSNFSVGQLAEILEICETEKFNAPVIYQGMYNLVARKVEDIFPLIREHGIDFWAYNPLAGGLLTGKYTDMDLSVDVSSTASSTASSTGIGTVNSASSTGIGTVNSASSTGIGTVNSASSTGIGTVNSASSTGIGTVNSASSTGIGTVNSASSTGIGTVNSASRFHGNSIYQNIFWKPAILKTLNTDFYYENESSKKKSEKKCITDAFQWVKSKLLLDKSEFESIESGDRIILGASTKSQLLENMNAIHQNGWDYNYERLENIFSKIGEQSPNYFY